VYESAEMHAMIESASRGRFEVLTVAYVARWQRNLRRTLELLEDQLHPAGVAVWFCDEELLSSNPRHWDAMVDEAKAAESWLRKHRRRVAEGLAAKLAIQRDPGGHPPFGFRRALGGSRLMEPDPTTLPVVRQAFALSAKGVPDREVARQLGLSIDVVRGVLKSPLYLGRLRDGGRANWPPVIDLSTWNSAVVVRAGRATMTGRPASPRRPYALSGLLRCAACGRNLIGDTDFYRHTDACEAFRLATPPRPPGWHGRSDGKGYRRRSYEDLIGQVLGRMQLDTKVIAEVVAATAGAPGGPDRVALQRIEKERSAAAQRVLRDRDYEALRLTMERLDREEAQAREPRVLQGVPAKAAVRYLRDLKRAWRMADGGDGRRMVAQALFESIDVLGLRTMRVRLTRDAVAHGFAAAVPDQMEVTVGYGRGERI
jgi:DNA invertase Pin-like site-specific DNA recombinase